MIPKNAFELAEQILTDVLSSVPYHAWAHCLMAAVLISTHRPDRGILECERALQLNSSLATAHAMLGLAKYPVGKGEDTERHVQEALRLSPLDSFAYLWMLFAGVAKIQADEFEDATMWLKRSIDTNTNSPWAHFHLGVALYLMDCLPEAQTAVQTGLRLDPDFTTERYGSFAASEDKRYVGIRERTIRALKACGVP